MKNLLKYNELILNSKEELTFHSKEVSLLASEFGIYLGLSLRDVKNLKLGGFIHDLGKIEISEDILYKTSRLTDEEFDLIKTHPQKGYDILTKTVNTFSKDILDIVLQHHERVDGKGYPNGLKGEEINPLAKIVALCDVYSAIKNARSYKESRSTTYALEQIEKGLDTHFDKELGQKFVRFMQDRENKEIKTHKQLL